MIFHTYVTGMLHVNNMTVLFMQSNNYYADREHILQQKNGKTTTDQFMDSSIRSSGKHNDEGLG